MRILMVNKYLYPKGGAETYCLKIGKYLEEHGHQVEYFGMYDEKNIVGNKCGYDTMNMDFHKKGMRQIVLPFKIIYSFEARRKIHKVIQEFRPDVIHMNNINFQLTPSIIDEAAKMGIPIVQTVHDYQMLCPNHLLFDIHKKKPCEKCIHGSKWNCAKNNCIHNSKAKSILGSLEGILYQHHGSYKKVAAYICPSKFIEEKLTEVPVFQEKTTVIHNFIERKDLRIEKKEPYVLFFGRLSEEKGFTMFFRGV